MARDRTRTPLDGGPCPPTATGPASPAVGPRGAVGWNGPQEPYPLARRAKLSPDSRQGTWHGPGLTLGLMAPGSEGDPWPVSALPATVAPSLPLGRKAQGLRRVPHAARPAQRGSEAGSRRGAPPGISGQERGGLDTLGKRMGDRKGSLQRPQGERLPGGPAQLH